MRLWILASFSALRGAEDRLLRRTSHDRGWSILVAVVRSPLPIFLGQHAGKSLALAAAVRSHRRTSHDRRWSILVAVVRSPLQIFLVQRASKTSRHAAVDPLLLPIFLGQHAGKNLALAAAVRSHRRTSHVRPVLRFFPRAAVGHLLRAIFPGRLRSSGIARSKYSQVHIGGSRFELPCCRIFLCIGRQSSVSSRKHIGSHGQSEWTRNHLPPPLHRLIPVS